MKYVTIFFLLASVLLLGSVSSPTVTAASLNDATLRETHVTAPPFVPNAQGCNGQPSIQYAYANPAVISAGQVTTLFWGLVGNANAAFLQFPDGHRQGIGTPGSQQVNPTQNTTYLIIGVCGGNEQAWPIQVTVNNSPGCNGTPQMNGFSANPPVINSGQGTTLSWGPVLNAQYVQLSAQNQGGSGVPAPGSINVAPRQTTTYYLTAWCQANTAQLQVTVTVNNAPPPPPPSQGSRITSITRNDGLSNQQQLVITVGYFWDGTDAPAGMQATAHNDAGQTVGTSNNTRINPNENFQANLRFAPFPGGMSSVTACIIGSSGTHIVCQSAGMR